VLSRSRQQRSWRRDAQRNRYSYSENAVRREIISDFFFSIMSNLLLFRQKMGTLPAAANPDLKAAKKTTAASARCFMVLKLS
jgi:hypothetical protein